MKKFMVPFHGFFLIIVFDGLAILYFLKAFTSEKIAETVRGRSFNFDLLSIVYAICSIAILYRLQYWEGWERWIYISAFLFIIISVLNSFSVYFFLKQPGVKGKFKRLIQAHLPWIYFLAVFPVVAFTNPRTFHNLFNGTTYEEYVRTRYPVDEGTDLLERYKPDDDKSRKCAAEYFAGAIESEKKEEYEDALDQFNHSIDLNPDDAKAVYNRGRLKLTRLETDKETVQSAYNDFCRAIQLDSTMAAAYINRAIAYNYLYPKNRIPAHNDLEMAKTLDTSLAHDKFINDFLALPLYDSTMDTTTYIDLDKNE